MDRRDFLTARRKKPSVIPPAPSFRTQSGLNVYNGPWTRNEVQHLLKRTMFGSTKADIDYFTGLSLNQAVDQLLTPAAPLTDFPLNDYSGDFADINVAPGTTWINDLTANEDLNEARRSSFKNGGQGR